MNKLILIGSIGRFRCYFNLTKEAAIARYIQSEALYPADFETMLTDGYNEIREVSFEDEFMAVDIMEM